MAELDTCQTDPRVEQPVNGGNVVKIPDTMIQPTLTCTTITHHPTTPISEIDAHLPTELLIRIFSRLEARSRCRATQVSVRWNTISCTTPRLWQRLDLSNRYSLGGEKNITISSAPSSPTTPTSSRLSICRDLSSPQLPQSPTFQTFTGVNATLLTLLLSPSGAMRFSRMTRLDLSCTAVDLTIFELEGVKDVIGETLNHLILNGCGGVDSGSLYHLRGLKGLRALDLSHCEFIDDLGLEVICRFLPHITHLNLSYLFRLTERGVARLFRLPGLLSVNLMGCYRIKAYPWALGDGARRGTLPIKDLMLGEDSRIQTRGFWLLWCVFQFDPSRLVNLCPFLETLRLNMVLFDLPPNGLETLLKGCNRLKTLSLVVDRTAIASLCSSAAELRKLKQFEATIHIGVTGEQVTQLVKANALPKLTALKFHSKHTTVFKDETLKALVDAAPSLEYLELNGDDMSLRGLDPVAKNLGKTLQSFLVHHVTVSNEGMRAISKGLPNLRELTVTDLQQRGYGNRIGSLVMGMETGLCGRLRKVELSSHKGFSDKDLARVPKGCPSLQ
ncbi:Leucine-rich repeat-containing protein 29 [Rhizophlyctis rosea]|uniref:Leucine-rich repeat-containing protein 29 n=1 Tax=Rhizophlyctis rosea TaxID=64517 RepID=A0AAD5S6A0_9FUNG|nr:Leucine-rich repeat-containing protein 29 [Rhizophlyctis rosea]